MVYSYLFVVLTWFIYDTSVKMNVKTTNFLTFSTYIHIWPIFIFAICAKCTREPRTLLCVFFFKIYTLKGLEFRSCQKNKKSMNSILRSKEIHRLSLPNIVNANVQKACSKGWNKMTTIYIFYLPGTPHHSLLSRNMPDQNLPFCLPCQCSLFYKLLNCLLCLSAVSFKGRHN